MCGIAGMASQRPQDSRTCVDRMLDEIRHRGPDDIGVDAPVAHHVTLGNVRLAVIDLSAAGHQPMWSADRRACITYNGEVYNFLELRQDLERAGHRFRSGTDTEVVLAGYREWGAGVCHRLNGMFAFAIWDSRERQLLMARDRLGEKPLYYWHQGDTLAFASELKAILRHPPVSREVDFAALQCYLALGYSPAPLTMFRAIRKLPAAHTASWSPDTGSLTIERYWRPPAVLVSPPRERELRRQVRAEVEAAVSRRLVSDVPVGAFLSGGVDSTIVVGVMTRLMNQPVRTFTTSFEAGRRSVKYNVDAEAARRIARHFNTDHCELVVTAEQVLCCMRDVARTLDEPVTTPMFQSYLLAREVRRHGVTVVLTGDGSDEIFGGYSRYGANELVERLALLPRAVLRRVGGLAGATPRGAAWQRAVQKALMPGLSADRYVAWWEYLDRHERAALTSPAVATHIDAPRTYVDRLIGESGARASTDLIEYLDLVLWVAEDSNMRIDKLCMAAGVEARAPFLDHLVVERGLSIPFARKASWRAGKRLLCEAFADLLPAETVARPKWGWWSPIYHWIRGPMAPQAKRYLNALPRTGLFSDAVRDLPSRQPGPAPIVIWKLMLLALWFETYVAPIGLEDGE